MKNAFIELGPFALRAVLVARVLLVLLTSVKPADAAESIELSQVGDSAFPRGDLREAAGHWEQSLAAARRGGDAKQQIRIALSLAQAYQSLGLHRPGVGVLREALSVASTSNSTEFIPAIQAQLGGALVMVHELDEAEALLNAALNAARRAAIPGLETAIYNELGNLQLVRQRYADALSAYQIAVARAREAGHEAQLATALVNAAGAAVSAGNLDGAEKQADQAREAIEPLADGHNKAFLLLNLARIYRDLAPGDSPVSAAPLRLRAHDAIRQALTFAERHEDLAIETYALGYLAQIYAEDGQDAVALDLNQRAVFAAQIAQLPEASYRWEWQIAKLRRSRGEQNQALAAYRRALQTLIPMRTDVSLGYGNARGRPSFRETEGPLFFEMADMLLQEARSATDPALRQSLLLEARDTVELLKTVELEDYFSDECVNVQRAQTRTVEAVDEHTAVIYLIPLTSRTEILIGLTSGMLQMEVPVGREDLTREVNQFRRNLETRTSYRYLAQARQLYNWLIRPIGGLLREKEIDTLVIAPDGALRTIPFAALNDGQRFLIEEFAVAVVPGLSLVAPTPIEREDARLLLNGLSEAVQGFPSLDFVKGELEEIQALYPSETLIDANFTLREFRTRLTDEQYSIVHIASHGQFDRDVRKTFLLTYDDKLTLDELEALIRPGQYRGRPVELLVLSACQTAAGDDQAALGLAGVAVKAGARSALATLWFVNDQSTSTLVSDVYRGLRDDRSLSKAKALQTAQTRLLRDRRYRHPCYWSPYLLIGNWL